MASRPNSASVSASNIWPRPMALISLSYYAIGHFSGKNSVKFGNFVYFSGNYLKSYVVNHYFFHTYFGYRPWPQPPEIGLGLGLGLEVLASFDITAQFCTDCSRSS